MNVLAFDIAYRTGWAVTLRQDPGLAWGSFGIEVDGEEGLGRGLYDFRRHLLEAWHTFPGIGCFAWEKPIQASKHSAAYDEYVKGAIGILRLHAFELGVRALPCDMKSVRRHFIGQGTGDAKRQVFQRCKVLGYDCRNDDESDAIAVWDYATGAIKVRDYAGKSQSFGGTGGRAFAAPRRAGGHRRL